MSTLKRFRGESRLDVYIKAVKIRSVRPQDVLIQHALCDAILIPVLSKYLIYDNGASQKHKGLSFARKRFECHTHKFFENTERMDIS